MPQVRLEPDDYVIFKSDYLFYNASTSVKLTNTTNSRQFFKVKTTSKVLYQVRPVYGCLTPYESVFIQFYFTGKETPDKHSPQYFDIYHLVNETETSAKDVWRPGTKADGFQRLYVKFLKSDGSEWPPNSMAPKGLKKDWLWKPSPQPHTTIAVVGKTVLPIAPTQLETSSPTQPLSAPTSSKHPSVNPEKPIQSPTLSPAAVSPAALSPASLKKEDTKVESKELKERLKGEIGTPTQATAATSNSKTSTTNNSKAPKSAVKSVVKSAMSSAEPTKSLGGKMRF